MKTSPGPWRLSYERWIGDAIRDANGELVIATYVEGSGAVISISEADARLIAAAPEMQALLRAIVDDPGPWQADVQAILGRIDGKSP